LLNMHHVFVGQGKLPEALSKLEEALPILQECHGEKSALAATALFLIGDIYRKQGKIDDSLKVLNRALRYLQRALGKKEHENIASCIKSIAKIHMHRLQFAAALGMWEEVVRIERGIERGNHHQYLTRALRGIAECKTKLGDVVGARAIMQEVDSIYDASRVSKAVIKRKVAAVMERL
jgi:tetratricopeptide (TPR) repeat protein